MKKVKSQPDLGETKAWKAKIKLKVKMPSLEKFNNIDGLKSMLHSDNKRQNEMHPTKQWTKK